MYTAMPTKPARQSALDDYRYDALDDLLYGWFCREQGYQPVEGYARTAVACDQSVSSRQWDSIEEVLESRVEAFVMPTITSAMDELEGDHRLAILIELRNRMGPGVWRNPRAGDRQPEAYRAARFAIAPILRRRGVEW